MSTPAQTWTERLFGLSWSEFADGYADVAPLIGRGTLPDAGRDLGPQELADFVTLTPLDIAPASLTLLREGDLVPPASYAGSTHVQAGRVQELYDAGAVIVLSDVRRRIPAVDRICAAVERDLDELGDLFVNKLDATLYACPRGAQAVSPSAASSQCTLHVQVRGTQRCEVDRAERTTTASLAPGDVMYVPRGSGYRVHTHEPSVFLSLALGFTTWRDVVLYAAEGAPELEDFVLRDGPHGALAALRAFRLTVQNAWDDDRVRALFASLAARRRARGRSLDLDG
jgi:Cupin superfamily protein